MKTSASIPGFVVEVDGKRGKRDTYCATCKTCGALVVNATSDPFPAAADHSEMCRQQFAGEGKLVSYHITGKDTLVARRLPTQPGLPVPATLGGAQGMLFVEVDGSFRWTKRAGNQTISIRIGGLEIA